MSERLNLTGVWTGMYTYPDGLTVPFTAMLLQSGRGLSGAVHEPDTTGVSDGDLLASVEGSVEGRRLLFRKLYDGLPEGFEASVLYDGAVSAEADEIEGRWTVPGSWSGTFLMVRERGPAVRVGEREAAKV
jgi:hypothetical protein